MQNIFVQSNVLGEKVSVNPIPKETLDFPKDSQFKYFYEPKPNSIAIYNQVLLPEGYDSPATINADSLNERFDYSPEKPQGVFRIITLGDSYTYGLYVNTRENYPERLEDLLNMRMSCQNIKKFEVINLGVGGYDIEYSVNRYKMRGQKYNPDLVLWFLISNDFFEINEILQPKVNQYRKEMLADKDLLSKFYAKGEFYPWWKKARQELSEEFNKLGGLKYQKAAIEKINYYYKGKLMFVTHSTLEESYISALRHFADLRSGTYIYDGLAFNYDHFVDWHPTSNGYEKIAGEIFNYIKNNNIIPCE